MPNRILINIGNTHVQVADVVSGRPRLMAKYDTNAILHSGVLPCLENLRDFDATALCVVPKMQEILQKKYGGQILFLTKDDFPQLDFSLVDVSTLGMDRISNAAFAFSLNKGAVMVIDFGTCIISVVVNEKGQFLGGAICPGRMLMRQALAEHTAQLPLVPIIHDTPDAIGNNTKDAICAGIDNGIVGAVRELIAGARNELDSPCTFLATGGDAVYFLKRIPDLIPAPELMTLRGILCAVVDKKA